MYPDTARAAIRAFTEFNDPSLLKMATIQRCFIPAVPEVCRWIYKELKILFCRSILPEANIRRRKIKHRLRRD